MTTESRSVFTDITAIQALINAKDPNHVNARDFIKTATARNFRLISSNQSLFLLADRLKKRHAFPIVTSVTQALKQSEIIHFESMTLEDESEAWRIFTAFDDPWWTVHRCACMALINRMAIDSIFSFDNTFSRYGLTILPGDGQ